MLEALLVEGSDPYTYTTWFDLDFTKYPVGFTSGYSDRGLTFTRLGGTSSVVLDGGKNAVSFNGDGVISAGRTPDRLLNKDWRLSFELKVKTGFSNPMIFIGRSSQASGTGTWIASLLANSNLDWWYNSGRVPSTSPLTKGVYHKVVFESLSNKLTMTVDGTPVLVNATIPNLADGTPFDLVIGGSSDQALYHSNMFLRSIKIETKSRL